MNRLGFIERIKEVIRYYGLTSSTFADSISVPKSSISHLMSGRNKPSLDFVLKIIDKFPEVDLYWLLNGEGDFPKSKQKFEKPTHEIKQEIATEPPITETVNTENTQDVPTLFSDNKLDNNTKNIEQKAIEVNTGKKLIKVILLYNDGSFDEFNK
ncbi:helix-turn-helix domain-containing protein [Tenacibaculum xiamenense]|uniref:helix-turn-helix domain-containing protein n=1 Tax=Tenacibaculum xiamenense TaxID=1261553 RepID=UPI00389605C2